MSLNQCSSAPSSKRSTDRAADYLQHPCEREPLLAGQTAPSPLIAGVLPRTAPLPQQQLLPLPSNSSQRSQQLHSSVQPNSSQPRTHHQHCKSSQPHQSRSHHKHHNHDNPQQQSLLQSQHHHHHHHHAHHNPKKWPVSSHFPEWDQREGTRYGASWKSRSAHARIRQPSEPGHAQPKNQCRVEADPANPAGLILPSLPKHYQVEEAGVRNKLRNLTRHYSDDSLHGSSNRELYSTRIHSSADEISSVNRSPSISSSDESFSRTDFSRTDADSPSPERAPSLNDVRFKYMFGDMNTDGVMVPRFRELSPQLYSDYLSSVKASSDESSLRLNSLTLDSSNHSHPNMAGVWRESDIGPPLTDSDRLRRDDLFIPKLTAEFSSDKVKRTKTDPISGRIEPNTIRSSASPVSDKLKLNFRTSFNESDMTSPYRGGAVSGSTSRLLSLERGPRGHTPEGAGAASKRRSLPRDSARRQGPITEQVGGGRKSASMREYDRKDASRSGSSSERKTPSDSHLKRDFECQTDPKRSHHRKASGDFERNRRLGKSSTFEGICEDPAGTSTSDRYGDRNRCGVVGCCSPGCGQAILTYSPVQSEYSGTAKSLASGSTLEGYSALQKLAKLQEHALLSTLEKPTSPDTMKLGLHFDPLSKRSILLLSPGPDSSLLSYEPGKEGSLLR